jgi:RNA polymerase-binding transcription factor DksA
MADMSQDLQDAETDFLLAARDSERLYEIDEALRRLAENPERYFICEGCALAIEPERLELVPWTRLCTRCARLAETG